MYRRHIEQILQDALSDSPVVLVNGARQTGKSTLVQNLKRSARYYTLDDPAVFAAARHDPHGFVAALPEHVTLDEVQRAPELFVAIKAAVDRRRTPGRFLLTGSANVLLLPTLSDSLAGRMEILTLWPLSQAEVGGHRRNAIDALWGSSLPDVQTPRLERDGFILRLTRGGYPEAYARSNEKRRHAWFDAYVTTLLQRDIRDLAQIEGLADLPRLLQLLAARSASLCNMAELSRFTGIAQTTLKRYLGLLDAIFLMRQVPAWSSNLGKRLQKTPKLYLNDSGLMANLLGMNEAGLQDSLGLPGPLVETFVHGELCRHQAWANQSIRLFHYRTSTGVEVDFVLENRQGELVGVEVKAAATVIAKDFKGLRHLRETAPRQFRRGVVLYTGSQVVPFDEQLFAVPMSLFWTD